ncbi:hypothetical protein DN069_16270 [Streptacidiphilus pinicola]|uniref:DUF7847 domain-containing protein n=1 Tax=Streptacidiphilus pinicola TaxID=2219663 RepID=A0A2X0KC62_9ACTN|nr:hypothetical protein [Streptacidiphilus pinicola]RAG84600.1 hypothetical protein DN069_16270 [Streptacidiphilus pinicola]
MAPKPGVIPLRPLSVGEIVNAIFTTIRYNFLAVYGPPLIIGGGFLAVLAVFGAAEWTPMHSFWVDAQNNAHIDGWKPSNSEITNTAFAFGGLLLLIMLAYEAVYISASLSSVATLRHAVVGRRIRFRQSATEIKPHFWRLVGATLLMQLICLAPMVVGIAILLLLAFATDSAGLIGLLAFLIVLASGVWGMYAQIRLVPLSATVVLEGKSPIEAIKRAWRLNEGAWWRSLGVTLLIGLIGSLIQYGVNQVISVFYAGAIGFGGSTIPTDPSSPTYTRDLLVAELVMIAVLLPITILVTLLTLPLTTLGQGLLYIDRRIRRESLDIQLAEEAGIPFAGAAPPTDLV